MTGPRRHARHSHGPRRRPPVDARGSGPSNASAGHGDWLGAARGISEPGVLVPRATASIYRHPKPARRSKSLAARPLAHVFAWREAYGVSTFRS